MKQNNIGLMMSSNIKKEIELKNKKEFTKYLKMRGMHGKKIHVCWRIYKVLLEHKENNIDAKMTKAGLMECAEITNWSMMLKRLVDMVNAGIITDTWEIVE